MQYRNFALLGLAIMAASPADAHDNCDVRQTDQTCALRPDALFERVSEGVPLDAGTPRLDASFIAGCDASTDRAVLAQSDLTALEHSALLAPVNEATVLVNARVDGKRWIYLAPDDVAIGFSANPDRVALRLPGQALVQDFLVDVNQGRARWCEKTRVFSVTARTPDAASVQLQSNPATQEVSAGDTAFLQIKIINNGTVALAPIAVTSNAIPSCARTLSSLGAGFSYTYTCNLNNAQQTTINTVSATGNYTGGSVSATATSTIIVEGGPPPPTGGGAKLVVCRLPWVQYAHAGEQAHWEITVTNTSGGALQNVQVSDPQLAGCNTTVASMNAGQAVTYTCQTTVNGQMPWRYYTTTATHYQNGAQTEEMRVTNGVITDHIAVNGFDGCTLGGTSTDFCREPNSYRPMLRRPNP